MREIAGVFAGVVEVEDLDAAWEVDAGVFPDPWDTVAKYRGT